MVKEVIAGKTYEDGWIDGYADGLRDGANLEIVLLNTKMDSLLKEVKAIKKSPNKMVVREQR